MHKLTDEEKQKNLLKKWNMSDNNGDLDSEDFYFNHQSDEEYNELNSQQSD